MKESKLVLMEKKIEGLNHVVGALYKEQQNLQQMAVGTLQLLKHFKGYDKALTALADENRKALEEQKAADALEKKRDGDAVKPPTS